MIKLNSLNQNVEIIYFGRKNNNNLFESTTKILIPQNIYTDQIEILVLKTM